MKQANIKKSEKRVDFSYFLDKTTPVMSGILRKYFSTSSTPQGIEGNFSAQMNQLIGVVALSTAFLSGCADVPPKKHESVGRIAHTPHNCSVGGSESCGIIHYPVQRPPQTNNVQLVSSGAVRDLLLNKKGGFMMSLAHDLHLDPDIIARIIQRESKGLLGAVSSKGAKGPMQLMDNVIEDMQGETGVFKYGRLFLSLRKETVEKIPFLEDKKDIYLLQDLLRSITKGKKGEGQSKQRNIQAFDNLLEHLQSRIFSPDVNVIFGSVYYSWLLAQANKVSEASLAEMVKTPIGNLTDDDIATINKRRIADGKKPLPDDYDFTRLDSRKVLALAWYNAGPNAKAETLTRAFLYAIVILA